LLRVPYIGIPYGWGVGEAKERNSSPYLVGEVNDLTVIDAVI
jgi:hypothetical protein